ncbi:MAG: hypothetical protein ABIH99_01235 [Candidatus Micrarchaeota archaeon]
MGLMQDPKLNGNVTGGGGQIAANGLNSARVGAHKEKGNDERARVIFERLKTMVDVISTDPSVLSELAEKNPRETVAFLETLGCNGEEYSRKIVVDIETIVECTDNQVVKDAAQRALERIERGVTSKPLCELKGEEIELFADSISSMSASDEAYVQVISSLEEENPHLRAQAMLILKKAPAEKTPGEELTAALEKAFERERDPKLLVDCLLLIRKYGGTKKCAEMRDGLRKKLTEADSEIRRKILFELKWHSFPEFLELYGCVLNGDFCRETTFGKNERSELRSLGIECITKIGSKEAAAAIMEMLKNRAGDRQMLSAAADGALMMYIEKVEGMEYRELVQVLATLLNTVSSASTPLNKNEGSQQKEAEENREMRGHVLDVLSMIHAEKQRRAVKR